MDKELIDALIEEITIDAYGDEGYWAFLAAFEDLALPPRARVVGQAVELASIEFDGDERRGLTASVRRGGRRWTVSVLDLEFPKRSKAARVLAAYRQWLGPGR